MDPLCQGPWPSVTCAWIDVLADLAHHRQQGSVGFAGTGGRTNEQILVGLEARLVHLGLNDVERLEALEGRLRVARQLVHGHPPHLVQQLVLLRGHVHLLVALLLLPERALRQLALLVAHEVTPLRKPLREIVWLAIIRDKSFE